MTRGIALTGARVVLGALALLLGGLLQAAVRLEQVRVHAAPDTTRVVFDVSAPVVANVFVLDNPRRVVIDLPDAALPDSAALARVDLAGSGILHLRSGKPRPGVLRIVLDVDTGFSHQSFLLDPVAPYGHRMVVDLRRAQPDPAAGALAGRAGAAGDESAPPAGAAAPAGAGVVAGLAAGTGPGAPVAPGAPAIAAAPAGPGGGTGGAAVTDAAATRAAPAPGRAERPAPAIAKAEPEAGAPAEPPQAVAIGADRTKPAARATTVADPPARAAEPPRPAGRVTVIAVDAGHGGEDPGAIGPGGIREKTVVLAIARKLAERLNRTEGVRAVLIRDGDYYIPLTARAEQARSRHRADLFVSIHADAFHNARARGASVYALSNGGASSTAARFLAQRENKADLIGGVGNLRLHEMEPTLKKVVLDMSMNQTMNDSLAVGRTVLQELGAMTHLHSRRVEQAGFMVLKVPDVPSILVETGYISNPQEARRLADPAYQQKIAETVARGLVRYLVQHPPIGSLLAERRGSMPAEYTIARGDTLSAIAQRFGVPLAMLKSTNGIGGDTIRVGQVLRIPTG